MPPLCLGGPAARESAQQAFYALLTSASPSPHPPSTSASTTASHPIPSHPIPFDLYCSPALPALPAHARNAVSRFAFARQLHLPPWHCASSSSSLPSPSIASFSARPRPSSLQPRQRRPRHRRVPRSVTLPLSFRRRRRKPRVEHEPRASCSFPSPLNIPRSCTLPGSLSVTRCALCNHWACQIAPSGLCSRTLRTAWRRCGKLVPLPYDLRLSAVRRRPILRSLLDVRLVMPLRYLIRPAAA